MIFLDTNVFMYAVGRSHPLRDQARETIAGHVAARRPLVTSAEVLQEFLHAYLPVGRTSTLDAALRLARDVATVWPVEEDDVVHARNLATRHPGLSARDLLHLSVCQRRDVEELVTFDQGLAAVWRS